MKERHHDSLINVENIPNKTMKPIPNNKMCQNNNTISNTVTSNFTPKNLNGYDLLDKNCLKQTTNILSTFF